MEHVEPRDGTLYTGAEIFFFMFTLNVLAFMVTAQMQLHNSEIRDLYMRLFVLFHSSAGALVISFSSQIPIPWSTFVLKCQHV